MNKHAARLHGAIAATQTIRDGLDRNNRAGLNAARAFCRQAKGDALFRPWAAGLRHKSGRMKPVTASKRRLSAHGPDLSR